MEFGVVFPQYEIGNDLGVIREFFETAEALGYRHVIAYDHVLGVGQTTRPDWDGLYDSTDAFHEPLVLFGYMAAIAPSLIPVTGVLVLPQRQTALVAKQATAVDLFSGGKLRLGVGVGWNEAEFDALGWPTFHDRGRYIEEQIALLRELWSNEVVTTQTRVERLIDVGINPRPARQIPIWMGGLSKAALQRAGRLADGWISQQNWSAQQAERVEWMRGSAAAAGRGLDEVAPNGVLSMWRTTRDHWGEEFNGWTSAGATVFTANTLKLGLHGAEHLEVLEQFASDFGLKPT